MIYLLQKAQFSIMIAVSNYSHEFVACGTPKYRENYSISQQTPCFSSSSAGVKVLVTSKALTLCQSLDRISSKTCLDDIFHVHVICIGIVINNNNNNHLVWSGLVSSTDLYFCGRYRSVCRIN